MSVQVNYIWTEFPAGDDDTYGWNEKKSFILWELAAAAIYALGYGIMA